MQDGLQSLFAWVDVATSSYASQQSWRCWLGHGFSGTCSHGYPGWSEFTLYPAKCDLSSLPQKRILPHKVLPRTTLRIVPPWWAYHSVRAARAGHSSS